MNPRDHPHRRSGDDRPILAVLDSWRFWVVIGFGILIAVSILAIVTFSRESTDRAARNASGQAEYQACLARIPILQKFERYIQGTRAVGAALLANSIRMHNITAPGSPIFRTQTENIHRLRVALNAQKGVNIPAGSRADCRKLLHTPQ